MVYSVLSKGNNLKKNLKLQKKNAFSSLNGLILRCIYRLKLMVRPSAVLKIILLCYFKFKENLHIILILDFIPRLFKKKLFRLLWRLLF